MAEKEVPASRSARARASSSGAPIFGRRAEPPRSGLVIVRFCERGACVCLGTMTALRPDHGGLVNRVSRHTVTVLAKGRHGTLATNCEVIAYDGRIGWPLQPPQGGQWLKDVGLRSSRANSLFSNGPRRHIAGDGRHHTSPSCRWRCSYSAGLLGVEIARCGLTSDAVAGCDQEYRAGGGALQLCSLAGATVLTKPPADIERTARSSVARQRLDSWQEILHRFDGSGR
jgi:hypothetical protein